MIDLGLTTYMGGLQAAWKGSDTDELLWYASFDGSSWSAPAVIPGASSSVGPALDIYNGLEYAAWKGSDGDQLLWYSSAGASGWAPQQVIPGAGSDVGPSLAQYNRLLWTQQRLGWIPRPVGRAVAHIAENQLPVGFKGRALMQSLHADLNAELPVTPTMFDASTRAKLGRWEPVAEALAPQPRAPDLLQRATRADFAMYLPDDLSLCSVLPEYQAADGNYNQEQRRERQKCIERKRRSQPWTSMPVPLD